MTTATRTMIERTAEEWKAQITAHLTGAAKHGAPWQATADLMDGFRFDLYIREAQMDVYLEALRKEGKVDMHVAIGARTGARWLEWRIANLAREEDAQ